MSMSQLFLDVSELNFDRESKTVLKKISLRMMEGERLVIAGETGSGKSTLLKLIAGLEQPTSGVIRWRGEKVAGPADRLVPGHPAIAYLSQQFELPKFLRVAQVLDYANHLSTAAAERIFVVCKISDLLQRKTDELSGGEKQRIAIARLLIQQPQLLLLDEPYAHLDMKLKATLKKVLEDIGTKLNISCVLVSHHPEDTLPWATNIAVLHYGKIVQQGRPMEIYNNPSSAYVAGLFGDYTKVDDATKRKLSLRKTSSDFVRPEALTIVPAKGRRANARVVSVKFIGNSYMLEVDAFGKTFLVRASQAVDVGIDAYLTANANGLLP